MRAWPHAWFALALVLVAPAARSADDAAVSRHVPPDPPQHVMGGMSEREMIELMAMDDAAAYSSVEFDQLEWREIDTADASGWEPHWDADAWYGNDTDKLWIKSAGRRADGDVESRNEILWNRAASRWWDLQAGIRHDVGDGPSRTWAAVGVHGLAPYWADVEATAYVGEGGRTALRVTVEYELLLTQRWVLRPELAAELNGKTDEANAVGSGLAHTELGIRLHYEVRREIAPYVGIVWQRLYGETADLADDASEYHDLQLAAGVRWWF